MRKVIESTLVSVDGVIGDPHQWTGEHFGEEAVARALEQLTRSDAMVMGRRTYEMFSNIWAEPVDDYATVIYSMRKYVFSSTLEDADGTTPPSSEETSPQRCTISSSRQARTSSSTATAR